MVFLYTFGKGTAFCGSANFFTNISVFPCVSVTVLSMEILRMPALRI